MRSGVTNPHIFKTLYMTRLSAQFQAPAILSCGRAGDHLDDAGLVPKPVWTPHTKKEPSGNLTKIPRLLQSLHWLSYPNSTVTTKVNAADLLAGNRQVPRPLCKSHVHRLLYLQTTICMSEGTSHASANWANQQQQQLNQLLLFQQGWVLLTIRTAIIWVSSSTVFNPLRHCSNCMCHFLLTWNLRTVSMT